MKKSVLFSASTCMQYPFKDVHTQNWVSITSQLQKTMSVGAMIWCECWERTNTTRSITQKVLNSFYIYLTHKNYICIEPKFGYFVAMKQITYKLHVSRLFQINTEGVASYYLLTSIRYMDWKICMSLTARIMQSLTYPHLGTIKHIQTKNVLHMSMYCIFRYYEGRSQYTFLMADTCCLNTCFYVYIPTYVGMYNGTPTCPVWGFG